MNDRPSGMYRKGRPVDPFFEPTECLFMRLDPAHVADGKPLCTGFRFPDQSVNREKYTDDPKWVLFPDFFAMAVAQFRVEHIPETVSSAGGVAYTFRVEHDPKDDNYGHSEIRVFRDKERVFKSRKVNSSAKLQFRMRLSEKSSVAYMPTFD